MDTLEEVLAHHGVKGMHWGQRKQQVTGKPNSAKINVDAAFKSALLIGAAAAIVTLNKSGGIPLSKLV